MKTKKGYTLRTLGNEYLLIGEGLEADHFGRMVSMNESAALLWKAVEGKEFDAATLANLLTENYGISHETAENDVNALLQSWKGANIIED